MELGSRSEFQLMQATLSFLTTFYHFGRSLMGLLRPWFIAACLLILAYWLLPSISQLADSYQVLLAYFPYILATIVILLGQQFVQGRLAMAAVNLILGYGIIQTQLQAPLEQNDIRAYFTLLSFYWPLNFFFIYWLPERKPMSAVGALLLTIMATQVLSAYLIVEYSTDYPELLSHYFSLRPFSQNAEHFMVDWILPLSTSILLAAASLILLIHALIQHNRSHCILLACMVISALVLARFDSQGISSLFSNLMACALLITLLFNSHDLAFLDELTGLPGRRALMNELKHCGKHYSIVMADIDHFKQFNDTHGHDTGDDVLRIVAQELGKVRGGGQAFRYGGEEFTLLFKRKSAEEAEPFVESIRQNISDYPLIIRDKTTRPKKKKKRPALQANGARVQATKIHPSQVQVTVSFGIAARLIDQKPEAVMKCADQALYRAKEKGRNCISN